MYEHTIKLYDGKYNENYHINIENCRDLETYELELSDSDFLQFCRLTVRKHETWTLMCLLFSTGQCLSYVSDSAQKARARI